jgi:hypothetical protein
VIKLVVAPVKGELKAGKRLAFRIERSHALMEVITRYNEETMGDDVLLIFLMPGKKAPYNIVSRRQFDEAIRAGAATSRSRMAKYIR